uniref:Uncharacterized protein n=1 Tax=Arundo donax TaxID=35708 RepID=A0A0A9ARE5_ARUDO
MDVYSLSWSVCAVTRVSASDS